MEENGIGRPSTYARSSVSSSIVTTVNKLEGLSSRSAFGLLISDLLTKSFNDIIDVEYTRNLEEDLDKIEQGKTGLRQDPRTSIESSRRISRGAGKEMQNLKERHQDRRGLPIAADRRC